jgi:hypothetical protein
MVPQTCYQSFEEGPKQNYEHLIGVQGRLKNTDKLLEFAGAPKMITIHRS